MKYLLVLCVVFGLLPIIVVINNEENTFTQLKVKHTSEKIDTSKYAILKFDKNRFKYLDYYFDINSKPTPLTLKDIKTIEALIEKCTSDYNKQQQIYWQPIIEKQPEKFPDPSAIIHGNDIKNPLLYYKQLIAVIDKNGEKIVFVNCFCSKEMKSSTNDPSYWKRGIIMVDDGGNCFFQLKVNLTTNKVDHFRVNGNA